MADVNLINGVSGDINSTDIVVTDSCTITAYNLLIDNLQVEDILYVYKKATTGSYFPWRVGKDEDDNLLILTAKAMSVKISVPGTFKIVGKSRNSIVVDYALS